MANSTNWFRRYVFAPTRRTFVLAVTVVVLTAFDFLTLQRQSPAQWHIDAADRAGLTVMSFNVLMGGKPASDAVDAIAAADPDLVCLQEMTADFAAAFEARLGGRYPHRLFRPNPHAQGIGIASRYKLSDGKMDMLGLMFLPSLSASLQGPYMQVHVACGHLIPPQAGFGQSGDLWATYRFNKSRRLAQVDALLNHLDGVEAPAIILGDMNEWPGQAAVAELTNAGFRDSCLGRHSRCGPTWPGHTLNFPATFRIDYILGRDVVFTDAAVLEAGGSDHYPVVAKIRPGRQLTLQW